MTDSKKSITVLIVDDEEGVRAHLSTLLTRERYQVKTCFDGDDAIGLLENESFDVVLLDIKMPHMGGFEVLKFIRERHPRTHVIMLTAFAELANAMESRSLGADGFIGKPFDPVEVLMELERVSKG